MMNSDKMFRIQINIRQKIKGTRLKIVNSVFEDVIDQETGTLDLTLPKGLYLLKITVIDYFKEELLIIDSNKTCEFDIEYACAPPVQPFKSTHEYYCEPAEKYSRQSTLTSSHSNNPNFFLFLAKLEGDFSNEAEESNFGNYKLYRPDEDGIIISEQNSFIDGKAGCLCFSSAFSPGLYFLEYSRGETKRIFPAYIFEGYQTQYFIRYQKSKDLTLHPDFKNCRIFFSESFSFDRMREEYFILEKILLAYTNYVNYQLIDQDEMNIIRRTPYLTTLINMLYIALGKKERINGPQLELPDLKYISESSDFNLSDQPPVMSFVMHKYILNSAITDDDDDDFNPFSAIAELVITDDSRIKKIVQSIQPASVVDRIMDNVCYDIFWTSFSEVSEPAKWQAAYEKVLTKIRKYPVAKQNIWIRAAKYMYEIFRPKMKSRELSRELAKDLVQKPAAASPAPQAPIFTDLKKVKEMSQKFQLPPTMILRNYEEYNKVLKTIKSSEKHKKVNFKEYQK